MRFSAIAKVLGIFLMIFSVSMLPPVAVSLYYGDGSEIPFLFGFAVTFLSGFSLWLPFRLHQHELKVRDGFLIVVLFWTVLSMFASIPMLVILFPKLTFVNAMFEAVSGLTTTGATVLTHLDQLPHAILYYRQQLHLLGGMGIIVLAVAILPMLGVGGMQLYRAETVGPIKTKKLRPRMAETAKALWYIYASLVVLCALSYWLAGMGLFDAIGESFSTVATGGFSIHDASFAIYHSKLIDCIGIFFMLAGATNFALHFQFLRRRRLSIYYKDPEWKAYVIMLGIVAAIIALTLFSYNKYSYGNSVINSLFTVVSLATTTGLTTNDFSIWPTFVPYLIMFMAIMGGCGGSTTGGIKVIRCLFLKEQGKRELKRLVHPQAVFSIKFGEELLPDSVIQSIWAFVSVFVLLFIVLLLCLLATGLDVKTAFGATASCLANTGASIGKVAHTFDHIPSASKWILILTMIAGRLEIFTLLVLFTPQYWRR